ncbi:hypothetical protein V8C40DRAFT_230192 [Trichoderma camerunense]
MVKKRRKRKKKKEKKKVGKREEVPRESSQPRLTASKCGCRPLSHIKTSRFPSILPSTRVSSWLWRPYMYVHVCFPFWISCDQPNHTHAHPNVGIGWPYHASHSLMAIYLLQPPFGLVLPLETAWAKELARRTRYRCFGSSLDTGCLRQIYEKLADAERPQPDTDALASVILQGSTDDQPATGYTRALAEDVSA